MNARLAFAWLAVPLVVASTAVRDADAAVLGRRHFGISFGETWLASEESVERTCQSVGLHLPVGRNLDLAAGFGESRREGQGGDHGEKVKNLGYGIALVGHVLPGRVLDPFVGAAVSSMRVGGTFSGNPDWSSDDTRFGVNGGVEINVFEKVSVRLFAAYDKTFASKTYDDEAVSAGFSVDAWLKHGLGVGVAASWAVDAERSSVSIRAVQGF